VYIIAIEKAPFRRYHENKKVDSFTVRLNKEEREELERCKVLIEQPKDSTALKQLARLGAKVLHRPEVKYLVENLFKNRAKNKRTGLTEFED
jgi:hypothetical protein